MVHPHVDDVVDPWMHKTAWRILHGEPSRFKIKSRALQLTSISTHEKVAGGEKKVTKPVLTFFSGDGRA